jgi:hypothetical protein
VTVPSIAAFGGATGCCGDWDGFCAIKIKLEARIAAARGNSFLVIGSFCPTPNSLRMKF